MIQKKLDQLKLPVFYRESLARLLMLHKFRNLIETNYDAGVTVFSDHQPSLFKDSLLNFKKQQKHKKDNAKPMKNLKSFKNPYKTNENLKTWTPQGDFGACANLGNLPGRFRFSGFQWF